MPDSGQKANMLTPGDQPANERNLGTATAQLETEPGRYERAIDEPGRAQELKRDAPGSTPEGKTAKYKDVIEFRGDDHRVLTSHVLGEDGKWHHFMTAHYRRTK